jgi:hypothetical protein
MEETYLTPNDRNAEADPPNHRTNTTVNDEEAFRRWSQGILYRNGSELESITKQGGHTEGDEDGTGSGEQEGVRLRMLDTYPSTQEEPPKPCSVCGSRSHLTIINSEVSERSDNDMGDCPLAWSDEWRVQPGPMDPHERCEISRYKLAKHIDYDLDRIPRVMKEYATYGVGKTKTKGFLSLMESSLYHICQRHQAGQGNPTEPKQGGEGDTLGDNPV